jgi:hippurate hydrolase
MNKDQQPAPPSPQSAPAPVDAALLAEAELALDAAVALRRRIHARPETGLDLPFTQAVIVEEVGGLGLDVVTGAATTSVVAVVQGDRPGPTTLLRADMDALEMPEDTGLDFASTVDGKMHACGHDAHVAMLISAARLLTQRRAHLAGRVLLMFQPGEEGHGGARIMLDEGLLRAHGDVDRAFALHITPTLPSGMIGCRAGALLASCDEFRIVVTGRGGHASMPHDATDPVPVACQIVTALQSMLTRTIPAFDPAVVTVTRIQAGTAFNVIPETVTCEGTIRSVSDSTRDLTLTGVLQVAEHVAAAHGCIADVEFIADSHYPVTINNGAAAERTLAVAADLLGSEKVLRLPTPVMGAEDWSYVLQQVPGSMAFLGAGPPGVKNPAPNHSNRMLIDEAAMATGIALHAALALN